MRAVCSQHKKQIQMLKSFDCEGVFTEYFEINLNNTMLVWNGTELSLCVRTVGLFLRRLHDDDGLTNHNKKEAGRLDMQAADS